MNIDGEVWDPISYFLGICSVLIWLCAQMPQIWKNWRRRSVEGLSPAFLVAWVAGDASNFVGCLMTGQLGVQVLLASYYCIVDVVLITQFFLYRQSTEYLYGYEPLNHNNSHQPSVDNTNKLNRGHRESFLETACSKLGLAITASHLVSTAAAAPLTAPPVALGSSNSDSMIIYMSSWVRCLGFLVAYFSTLMYLMSRVPQIMHNFRRKSTTGVSIVLFISAFLGNLTYTFSILLAPESMGGDANRKSFLLKELPYLLGAAGTMLFDCIIFGQWYWYHRIVVCRDRRATEMYDRISRPYLGVPRETNIPNSSRAPVIGSSHRLDNPSDLVQRDIGSQSTRQSSKVSASSSWLELTHLASSPHSSYWSLSNENAINVD